MVTPTTQKGFCFLLLNVGVVSVSKAAAPSVRSVKHVRTDPECTWSLSGFRCCRTLTQRLGARLGSGGTHSIMRLLEASDKEDACCCWITIIQQAVTTPTPVHLERGLPSTLAIGKTAEPIRAISIRVAEDRPIAQWVLKESPHAIDTCVGSKSSTAAHRQTGDVRVKKIPVFRATGQPVLRISRARQGSHLSGLIELRHVHLLQ